MIATAIATIDGDQPAELPYVDTDLLSVYPDELLSWSIE
jgi:hypothetical protein